MKRVPFAAENLAPAGDPNRGPVFVARELNAIGNNVGLRAGRVVDEPDRRRRRPKAIGLTEAISHRLPDLEHYHLVRNTETPGHANVALYLRDGLEGPPAEWVRHHKTWPRTEHPGPHDARVTLVKVIDGGPAIVVGHGPPNAPGAGDARAEWVEITAVILMRYKQVIWLGDPNGLLDDVLRRLGDPKAARGGDETDAVLVRGFTIESAPTPSHVNGVPMLTDHRKCLIGRAVAR